MRKPLLQEQQQLIDAQLACLGQVLREECPYVDREWLGPWCGLPRQWWLPGQGVSIEGYLQLLQTLHQRQVPDIALRVSRRSRIEDLGVLGYAMLASPTLLQGLQLTSDLAGRQFPYVQVGIDADREHALFWCEVQPAGADYRQLLLEKWLVSLWSYIQALLPEGLAACASYASLSYDAPVYQGKYQQILGCRVEFGSARSLLAIPRQWLYIAVQGGRRHALYRHQVQRVLQQPQYSGDLVSRVKRLLLEKPAECDYRLEATAPLLSLSARSLRRHLAQAGTSFRALCLDVRMGLARDYLLNTRLTAQEVAWQLGYSQPNNFYRAFKAFYGLPPERYRNQHMPERTGNA